MPFASIKKQLAESPAAPLQPETHHLNDVPHSFSLEGPNQMPEESVVRLKPIGVVHTAAGKEDIREKRSDTASEVEIFEEFEDALDGIEEFSHIFVIGYFDQLRPEQKGVLKVRPRRLLRYGLSEEELPLLGVFSLDSPSRPNPVGLSLVQLVGRRGRRLDVKGLDYFDGTPVIDIKPYQSNYRTDSYTVPEWHTRLHERAGRV